VVSSPNWAKIKKIKMSPEHWKLAHSSPRWHILWIWKKIWKKFQNFFFKFFFQIFFFKHFFLNIPIFFQIHKTHHPGPLCTNFQCSGIIFIFFKIFKSAGVVYEVTPSWCAPWGRRSCRWSGALWLAPLELIQQISGRCSISIQSCLSDLIDHS